MDETDRAALSGAFETARKAPERLKWIEERLAKGDAWESVAISCAYHCQFAVLDLKPWQQPPLYYSRPHHFDAALREPFGDPSGKREAAEIIKKLRAVGCSIYEPDPLAALAAAEQRQAE